LREVGWAEDGVVEAIEMPGHPVLGVQWHPEWHSLPDPVFEWLIDAAAEAL
jgi:putative glutamine amidotransferase